MSAREDEGPLWLETWLFGPQPLVRLEVVRMLAPLAILGFLSSRIPYATEWLTAQGFQVPDLGHEDYRQPLYLPPVPVWLAWTIVTTTVASGLALAAGAFTRIAAGVFAVCLAYLAFADRLAAFTVNKLGVVIAVGLFCTPAGTRWSVDAWLARRRAAAANAKWRPPEQVSGGNVRFFQFLLAVIYFSSGTAKARGDWLDHSNVVWSHLHDSYQTGVTYFLARHVPGAGWTVFQWATLIFELGAPLWLGICLYARPTRYIGLVVGLGMHTGIALMFGPVKWFAFLMMGLLIGCYAPAPWLEQALGRLTEPASAAAAAPSAKPAT